MKVILTGTTGFIGKEILHQCVKHNSITSIVILTRSPLEINDPKVKVLIHKDFSSYPDNILKELNGAESCIW